MHTAGQSLLDEVGFMAELGDLEAGLTSTRHTSPPAGVKIDSSLDTSFDWPAPVTMSGKFANDDPAPKPMTDDVGCPIVEGPSVLWRVTAVAMFVLLMGVGAAGAVAVFHERVGRIVATWQS